jgi:hypothetical protein
MIDARFVSFGTYDGRERFALLCTTTGAFGKPRNKGGEARFEVDADVHGIWRL